VNAPVRVGVAGLGKVTQLHHLPNLASSSGFEITALCDLSAELAHVLAAQYAPGAKVCGDHREMLDSGIDALVVTNRHHGPLVRDAIDASVPVFVEKPVCWGLAEAEELSAAVQRTGTPVVVGYMKRYDPAVERLVDSDDAVSAVLGRVHNFAGGRHRHERLYPVRKPGADRGADTESVEIDRLVVDTLGTGHPTAVATFRTFAELAIHDLNLVRALLGDIAVLHAHRTETAAGSCHLVTLTAGGVPCTVELLADFGSARDWDEQVTFYTQGGRVELSFASPFLRNAPTTLTRHVVDGLETRREDSMLSRVSP
jgi:predicted dehydrogenase